MPAKSHVGEGDCCEFVTQFRNYCKDSLNIHYRFMRRNLLIINKLRNLGREFVEFILKIIINSYTKISVAPKGVTDMLSPPSNVQTPLFIQSFSRPCAIISYCHIPNNPPTITINKTNIIFRYIFLGKYHPIKFFLT